MADTDQRHKRGGLYFEDFEVGKTLPSTATRRTVTQMDNMLFSNMTLNPQPLHIDRHFCETGDRVGPAADEFAVHARPDDRHPGVRHDGRHHHRQSRHDRRELSQSAVRGRHRPLHDRGRGQARVEVAPRRRHRRIPSPGVQAGRQAGRRVPPPRLHASCGRNERPRCGPFSSCPPTAAPNSTRRWRAAPTRVIVDLEDSIAPERKAAARASRAGVPQRRAAKPNASAPPGAHQRRSTPA